MKKYAWKTGHVKADAQEAGEFLEKTRIKNNGRLTAEIVVRSARAKRSPLHRAFEWDDMQAAQKHRLERASEILRQLVVIVRKDDDSEIPTRAFVNIRTADDRSYTSIQVAMKDPDMRAVVLADAWRELQGWQRRYREYEELAEIMAVIDVAAEQQIAS